MPTIRQHEVDAATWAMLNACPSVGVALPLPASPGPPSKSSAVAVAEPDGTGWSVTLTVPCRVASEMNERCHWSARSRRFKQQSASLRRAWDVSLLGSIGPIWERLLPIVVTWTRIGKKQLDSDNLASAFKGLRDALADLVGLDDGDERVEWEYEQECGEPGVRVTIGSRT